MRTNRTLQRPKRPVKRLGLSMKRLRFMIECKIEDERDPKQKQKYIAVLRDLRGGDDGR